MHPLQEYFLNLPEWDQEVDYIKALANTITVLNNNIWHKYLKEWLEAVAANIISIDYKEILIK